MKPTLTVGFPSFDAAPGGSWRSLLDLARSVEDAGIDRVIVSDHVVMGYNVQEYSWGKFPQTPETPWLEPLTLLASIGAVTSSVRLATNIVIAALRPGALLAKTVATLDVMSGGRVDLGVGTGWQKEEYIAEGLDFEKRGQLLTDTIAACRALWENTPADFDAPTLSFEKIVCLPKPLQSRLPVWFSGVLHKRNVSRIVELGDGWIPIMGATITDVEEGMKLLRSEFEKIGRPTDQLITRLPIRAVHTESGRFDPQKTVAPIAEMLAAGVSDFQIGVLSVTKDADDPDSALRSLVKAFGEVVS